MRTIKTFMIGILMLTGSVVMAQEKDIKNDFQKNGDIIEAVFYHENGEIAQEGQFKDGKLHGEWIAYDKNGKKTAIGKYAMGDKVGKWFFWNDEVLSEVDYNQSRIVSVSHWKSDGDLVSN